MTTNAPAAPTPPAIRFSRTMGLTRAIAMGSCISLGLGVFVLMGLFLEQGGLHTPAIYLLAMFCFIPIGLTYAERAAVTPGPGGAFALVRGGGLNWRTYTSGWLLLGGHLALIALLGWGSALYLNMILERLLGLPVDTFWLAPAMVVMVALNDLIGTQGGWRARTLVVYGGILVLLLFVAWFWGRSAPVAQPLPFSIDSTGRHLRLVALMAAMLWGVSFVLDSRDELRRPARLMLPALLGPVLLSGLIGAAGAGLVLRTIGLTSTDLTPLVTLAMNMSLNGEPLFEVALVTSGLLISLTALDRSMVTMLRLIGTMARDGFIPERFLTISPGFGTPLIALRLLALLSALAAAFVPRLLLVGLVALAFLATTALLGVLDVLRLTARLPEQRSLKLPLHPLFPVMTTVISLLLMLVLPPVVLLVGLGWVGLGVLYYVGYARTGGMEVRRRETVVAEGAVSRNRSAYAVLVCVANPDTAAALMHTGALLARAKEGRLLVLEIAVFPDQVPQYIQRQLAQEQLHDLNAIIQRVKAQERVPVEVLVRLAQSPVEGILGTAQEEKVDLLVLGWEGQHIHDQFDAGPLLGPVVRAATCDVVVVRGCLPDLPQRILVPTTDSPNALAAVAMGQSLAHGSGGKVVALNLVQDAMVPGRLDAASRQLRDLLNGLRHTSGIELQVTPAEDVTGRIVHESQEYDLLLLGASRGGILDQTIFGGLPVEVARTSTCPLMLVKHYEGARRFWVRRAWEALSGLFPSLTLYERTEVYQNLRQQAHPSIDFFIMIGLSSMIATLGLLQGSPAVIIGAMLVAPLMSPILAMGICIVQGDLWLLRLAARSMLSGVAVAIGIGVVVTAVAAAPINTAEILARTRPNLLDLLVALASGAAGGYAIARKEVATALPGVAIAAALVPPLGVVGYGTATGQLEITGGALLLFVTNLIAIVVAAAVVFLLLGFRPPRARLRGQVRLKFLVSLLALIGISVPLAFFSISTVDQIARQNQVETILNQELAADDVAVTNVTVERQGEGFVVYATIYALEDFAVERVPALQERLEETVDVPVTLRATVLRAMVLPETDAPDGRGLPVE